MTIAMLANSRIAPDGSDVESSGPSVEGGLEVIGAV